MLFRFASPWFFLLLAFIPVAVYFNGRRILRPVMGYSSLFAVKDMTSSFILRIRWLLPILKYLALCLVIAAMARPQWGIRQEKVMTEGVNIILAVDLSESMMALDFRLKGKTVNRLDAVRGVVRDFVAGRAGDRIGMVVFGSEAYTQLPLTRDYSTIVSILEKLEIGAAGKSTAIGDAIGISLKRIEDIKSKSNIIILLTDGRSNSGEMSPDTALEIAAQKKVKIYTIGVGSKGEVPFLIRDPLFGDRYVRQRVDIDEGILKKIAEKTGGLYFRAENTKGLSRIYDTIDNLEKTEVEVKIYDQYNELYAYFLIPALILIGLKIILSNTRFLSVP
ncbi:VWA domain-containing protein [Desulfobacterales bacterium HSG16]|nr:VWA domain-containing protein [Desulfobacterales bacterium HSG16]